MADEQEHKNSGSGKGLLIALIGLVIFLIIAVIGGGFFLYSHALANNGAQQEHHEEVKKEEAVDKGGSFKADVSDLVLNLTDSKGKDKIMKLLSVSNASLLTEKFENYSDKNVKKE